MPPSRNNIPQTQRFQKGRFFLFLTAGLRELGLRADASDLESISSGAAHWLSQGCVGWLVRPPHFEVCFGNMYLCVYVRAFCASCCILLQFMLSCCHPLAFVLNACLSISQGCHGVHFSQDGHRLHNSVIASALSSKSSVYIQKVKGGWVKASLL